ncbi:F14J16.4 [Arabidopsis thaliana]|uniref:F14J16.4 n=1 Tax=Arabidopsis thaliana TaxID=3702 RepID=Q9LG33_ARATH|nr:F14J16.4 [Arabidopsis thaliana]
MLILFLCIIFYIVASFGSGLKHSHIYENCHYHVPQWEGYFRKTKKTTFRFPQKPVTAAASSLHSFLSFNAYTYTYIRYQYILFLISPVFVCASSLTGNARVSLSLYV